MVNRTELITLHVNDLFKLLGESRQNVVGTMALMADGEHLYEADLDALCMVLKIESESEARERSPAPSLKIRKDSV